jgi:hypothetical protein
MNEVDKILQFEKPGEIVKYERYVDDGFIICEKNPLKRFWKTVSMNSLNWFA